MTRNPSVAASGLFACSTRLEKPKKFAVPCARPPVWAYSMYNDNLHNIFVRLWETFSDDNTHVCPSFRFVLAVRSNNNQKNKNERSSTSKRRRSWRSIMFFIRSWRVTTLSMSRNVVQKRFTYETISKITIIILIIVVFSVRIDCYRNRCAQPYGFGSFGNQYLLRFRSVGLFADVSIRTSPDPAKRPYESVPFGWNIFFVSQQ